MDFDFYFPPEYLKAALLVSLLSVWVLVGLFAYLNHYTRRRYFTLWMAAWLFYALWLTLTYRQGSDPSSFILMAKQWCVGMSATFLYWGSLVFLRNRVRERLIGLFMLFLLLWSYLGVYHVENPLQAKIPIFGMFGLSSIVAARCFLRYRIKQQYMGAGLLAGGFFLWGIFLAGSPFWEANNELLPSAFFIAAVLQLFIAVSMIVLVLEEARHRGRLMQARTATERDARRGLQHQVRSSEDRYRKLFDEASDAIVIVRAADLALIEINARGLKLLGLNGGDPLDQTLDAFIQTARPPAACAVPGYIARLRSEPCRDLVSRNGTSVSVELAVSETELEGEAAYQFVFREVTEKRRLEQQIRQTEKLSALGQMISGIAHELNNPLAVIKGYLELVLEHHELAPQTRNDLVRVVGECNRAVKLVRNFLSFARQQPQERGMVELNELLQRVVELRRFDFLVAGVETRLELACQNPRILADSDQIQQLFINLITNSLQAMANAEPPLQMLFRIEVEGDIVRASIEDSGPGVPEELQNRIFEPFFTTKEVGVGTGLGLSIAYSVMSEHRGRILYRKSSLGGAGFIAEFPLANELAASNEPVLPTTMTLPILPELSDRRVLVLDDERVIAEMLGEMVLHLGHRPTVCSVPQQALTLLDEQKFDVLISDYRMPGMDGRSFYHEVKRRFAPLSQNIIFLTGDVVNGEAQEFLSSTGNICLTKPFQLRTLQDAITQVLSGRAKPASEVAETETPQLLSA